MDFEKFTETLEKIEMPQEMQERIIRNCSSAKTYHLEEHELNRETKNNWLKRPVPVAAVLSIFICFTIVGTAAVKTGFFKDITRWNGAVIGTAYEQASEEMEASVTVVENELMVFITMLTPDKAPYSELEELGIDSYQIRDMSGNVVVHDADSELSYISNGQAEIKISLEGIESGNYKLVISQYVGTSKADQPLEISGIWECEFEIT